MSAQPIFVAAGNRREIGTALATNLAKRIASGEAVRVGAATVDRLEGAAFDRSPVSTKVARLLGRDHATVGDVARAVIAYTRDGLPLRPTNEPHHSINRGAEAA